MEKKNSPMAHGRAGCHIMVRGTGSRRALQSAAIYSQLFGVKCHHHSPSHLSPRQVDTGLWSTASDDMLSLVAGSLLGLGGGCFLEVGLPTSSSPPPPLLPPPTECSDWERTEKPWPQASACGWGMGMRSWGSGMVMEPMRKCLPSVAMSSPVLKKKQSVWEKNRGEVKQTTRLNTAY